MILKKLLLASMLSTFLLSTVTQLANAAPAAKAPYVVYWGSWSSNAGGIGEYPRSDARNKLAKGVTQLNLSFATVKQNNGNFAVIGSDGFLDPATASDWRESAYNTWTGFKFHNPEVKMLLAIGGATYSDIWTTTLTRQSADAMAESIKNAVNRSYPVYHFNSSYKPEFIGNVTLDGVDLDVETSGTLSAEQAENVSLLISKLREKMPNKLITLTVFSTAADPVSCRTTPAADCSYAGSVHSGEIIPVLTAIGNKIDYVNNMAYDAGKNYNYKLSMSNYQKYIPANKLLLGVDLEKQWSPDGNFLETIAELKNRATWAQQNPANAGGLFVWGIVGDTGGYPIQGANGQFDIIGQLIGESQPVEQPTQIEISSGSVFGTKITIADGDKWYDFDYIAPDNSRVYTTSNSWNVGQLANKSNLQIRVQLPNQTYLWCNGENGAASQAGATQKLNFNANKKIKVSVVDQGGYKLKCSF